MDKKKINMYIHYTNIKGKAKKKFVSDHPTDSPFFSLTDSGFLPPAVPKARDGRYLNAPHPSVCPSVHLVFAL